MAQKDGHNSGGRQDGGRPVTLITGATKGIGLSFAGEFARRGHALFLVARARSDLEALAADLARGNGQEIHTLDVDLTAPNGCEKLEAAVRERGLFVEYLVNNAGYGLAGFFYETGHDKMLNQIDLNIRALTDLCRRFLPAMVEAGRGGILNVSSMAGLAPGPYQSTYYASKAYVNSLSAALAHENARFGVQVSYLTCGPVKTEFHNHMGTETAYYTKVLGLQDPDEVARYATRRFLAGRRFIVPGFMHKISVLAIKATPHFVLVPLFAWLLKRRAPVAAAGHKGQAQGLALGEAGSSKESSGSARASSAD